jgi:hypothetical protein
MIKSAIVSRLKAGLPIFVDSWTSGEDKAILAELQNEKLVNTEVKYEDNEKVLKITWKK